MLESDVSPSSLASVELLITRARKIAASNRSLLKELSNMRAEEHTKRQTLTNVEYPLVLRWCQEADQFLDELRHVEEAKEDEDSSQLRGTKKLMKSRAVHFDQTVSESMKGLERVAEERLALLNVDQ